ncbi:response regulator [Spirosoma lituiforme]
MKNSYDKLKIKANFKRAKVLIVEDSDDHWLLIERAMQECLPEITPVRAVSSQQALVLLHEWQHQEWEIPKLIIQDLYLPSRAAGWQLLRQIKQMPVPFCQVPVIMLSWSDDCNDIIEAYTIGAASYLVKPVTFAEWLDYFHELRTYWWETVSLLPLQYIL